MKLHAYTVDGTNFIFDLADKLQIDRNHLWEAVHIHGPNLCMQRGLFDIVSAFGEVVVKADQSEIDEKKIVSMPIGATTLVRASVSLYRLQRHPRYLAVSWELAPEDVLDAISENDEHVFFPLFSKDVIDVYQNFVEKAKHAVLEINDSILYLTNCKKKHPWLYCCTLLQRPYFGITMLKLHASHEMLATQKCEIACLLFSLREKRIQSQ